MAEEYTDWQDEEVKVVRNIHGYCSIWPAHKANPNGWEDVGQSGKKGECLAFIKEHCDENAYWVEGEGE